ncbi:hybrid sensor histidine kinase/response regulator [Pseudogemmobacter sonorensis]|uniref:hybrid sensor histidine kinase/response regulator n=1 Tax=Pseudogemmobacter sonorensis TaxID=2989681 RepID=UPI0036D125B7
MPRQNTQSRLTFRWTSALCVILAPTLGAQLVLGARPALSSPELMLTSVMIWSVIVHFVLFALFAGKARDNFGLALLLSGLGLFLLPGMPLMWGNFLPDADGYGRLDPLAAVFFWVAGIAAVLLSRAAWLAFPRRLARRRVALGTPAHLIVTGLVLTSGFLLATALRPLVAGDPPALGPVSEVSGAVLSALYTLAASALALQGLGALRESDDGTRPAAPLVVMAFVAAVAVLALALALPELAPPGQVGGVATVLLGGTLVGVVLLRRPVPWLAAAALLTAATLAFNASQTLGGPVLHSVFAVLLIAILFSIGHAPAGQPDPVAEVALPPPQAMALFHAAAQAWIVRIDLDERTIRFPGGSGDGLGHGDIARFDEIFSASDYSGLIDLVQVLRGDAPAPATPISLQLTRGGGAVKKEGGPRVLTCEAHVLSNHPPEAWLALVSLEREREISARLLRYEQLLGEAILREERLLSIASHELRTPIAILSMLGEELKSGTDWDDIGASFEKTLDRIIAILDDLRAGSGAGGGQSAVTGFTIREMAQQVVDIFSAAATGNGITLEFVVGENSDTLLHCDYSRIFIALSKLVHNAVVHSRGTEVTLSAFLTKGIEEERSVTWQVADNGIGIAPERREKIFEPFESGAENPEERPGLGLYTARKAIRLMGGGLVIDQEGRGSRFVLTHPARAAKQLVKAEEKVLTMNDVTPLYADRGVLLVEDNKLVGEITSARLRKLFQRVDWAESGDAGLNLFRQNQYDMIVVDQLLPGLIGSELVREIRQTHKTLPVIGITASTMGSECRDLEEAGANYALEKPLSFGQLKSLAEEFFGKAPDAEG